MKIILKNIPVDNQYLINKQKLEVDIFMYDQKIIMKGTDIHTIFVLMYSI